jgi:hypothetical protein
MMSIGKKCWYNFHLGDMMGHPSWGPIAREVLYLIYNVSGRDNMNISNLYDHAKDHPSDFPHVTKLSEQQFYWRSTVILRKIPGWTKANDDSHFWRFEK